MGHFPPLAPEDREEERKQRLLSPLSKASLSPSPSLPPPPPPVIVVAGEDVEFLPNMPAPNHTGKGLENNKESCALGTETVPHPGQTLRRTCRWDLLRG